MTMLLQATVTVPSWDQLRDGLRWLESEVTHPDGFVSLRIFRSKDDPLLVTMLEEWESLESFEQSFETYSLEQRAEFMKRLGLTPENFERHLWFEDDPLP